MADPMDDMIQSLNKLAELPELAARAAMPLVLKAFKSSASAGTDPYGKAWVQKKDGGKPLVNAADAITGSVSGTVIVMTLTGINVLHNFGTHKVPKRQIMPDRFDFIPKPYSDAIHKAADAEFAKITGAK